MAGPLIGFAAGAGSWLYRATLGRAFTWLGALLVAAMSRLLVLGLIVGVSLYLLLQTEFFLWLFSELLELLIELLVVVFDGIGGSDTPGDATTAPSFVGTIPSDAIILLDVFRMFDILLLWLYFIFIGVVIWVVKRFLPFLR